MSGSNPIDAMDKLSLDLLHKIKQLPGGDNELRKHRASIERHLEQHRKQMSTGDLLIADTLLARIDVVLEGDPAASPRTEDSP